MSQSETETVRDIRADYGYGWHVDDTSTIYKAPKGLTHELLDVISDHKSEPDWMRKFRRAGAQISRGSTSTTSTTT
jgi:hypothetical protein